MTAYDADRPRVVVGIPAYNEERSIADVVARCLPYARAVIVVDDGSTDLTALRAIRAGAMVIRHRHNAGKGAAVATLLRYAKENLVDTLVLIDGDGQHNPAEIPTVAAPCLRGEADVVVGSRYRALEREIPRHRSIGLRAFNLMTALGSGVRCSDSQSGFRAFNRRAICAMQIVESSFSVECEQQFECRIRRLRLVEVPISCSYAMPEKRSAYLQGAIVLCRLGLMILSRRILHIPPRPRALPVVGFVPFRPDFSPEVADVAPTD